MRRYLLAALLALVVLPVGPAACGKDEPEASEGAPEDPARDPAPAKPSHPESEEALVEAVARAIKARRIADLQTLAAPELAADLFQMFQKDAGSFWQRGQTWVDNVASGFVVQERVKNDETTWRALLVFENGARESVTFTKLKGKLVFQSL